ncbi:MAG: outer membrane protein assembly factor BamE [Betaproteobacteria bacterium]|nr:outer membrane protein assembly factor BamE [Betaproteobacteria bacterium]
MRKSVGLSLVSLVSLLVSSCATNYSPTPYWLVPEQALYSLKPGVTTKDDVLRNVGEPLMRSYFPRQNQEVWDYSYLQGSAMRMAAYVYFDGSGRYLYSAHVLDPAYWNVDGGVSR